MSRKRSSTAATGGKGFTFADKVAAAFFVQTLAREYPLEQSLGLVTELDFETKESGRSLDDLHLLLQSGSQVSRWSISVKSNRQLTRNGLNPEFVHDAWAEWRNEDGSGFDQTSDLLGIVTGVAGERPLHDWEEVRKEASDSTPERFLLRLVEGEKQISSAKRKLFESLYPVKQPDRSQREETVRLAARLYVQHFNEKKDEGRCINQCAELVSAASIEEGTKLWNSLCQLAANSRGTGGHFDVPRLLRHLRATFDLRDYPDFKPDWDRLDALTSDNLAGVRAVLGDGIRLNRHDEVESILKSVEEHPATIVVGESGCGKSALVKQVATTESRFGHIVWLAPAQLSKASQNEIAISNGLRHNVTRLIGASSRSASLLVIDAFEKFEGEASLRLDELLRALRDECFNGWKLIVTGQPQSWGKVERTLLGQGVTDLVKIEVDPPPLAKVRSAVQHLPGIGALFLRTELQPILRNLTVLDWVLRTDVGQRLSKDPRSRIGETDLINSIWEYWISKNRRLERDRLLRKLGLHEGGKLSGAVSIDSVDQTELTLLEDLSREELLRIHISSVRFSHDLIGDWARFRVLACEGDGAIVKIKSVIQIPRWNRAVRLFAQSLVEGKADLVDWQRAIAALDTQDPESKLARDLFLEAILFAANSTSLLEAVWPTLIADDGKLLKRLIDRLLHVASFPDPRVRAFVSAEDADQSESWFRIPIPIYWYPALHVFEAHAADIAEHALHKGAEVCTLWLRNMPEGVPGRKEAAQLALALARELQDRMAAWFHYGRNGKVVFEAVLLGAADDPDGVAQIALELSGRRPEPKHAIERRRHAQQEAAEREVRWREEHPEEYEKRRASARACLDFSPIRPSRRRPTRPDAPQRRVPEGFRGAVMDSDALSGMISHRPEIAKEVLLAVCLEDPGQEEKEGPFQSFGLALWQNGYPPMCFKGPFLTFLRSSPQGGLETIVKLSKLVTEEWLRATGISQLPVTEREKYGLKFDVGGKTIFWFGNSSTYNLHRDGGLGDNTIACALMALEKWLYDEVSAQRSVDSYVEYIFENASSLAFAGVLVSLGLYHPVLFTGCLQPLLGNLHIYDCQSSAALNETYDSWSIGFAGRPQQEINLASAWNRMPHRRILLRDLAPQLMFQDPGTKAYFKARVAEWESHAPEAEEEKLRFQLFLARFRPENCQLTPHGGGILEIKPTLPEAVERKRQISQAESEFRLLSHGMALRARRLLDREENLSEQELPGFFELVKRLQQPKYPDRTPSDSQYRLQSLAGGLAVMFINHRNWLSENPSQEQWSFEALKNFPSIGNDESYGPESGDTGHNSETFLGEIGIFLLQERGDEWIRRIAFDGVTGFYYGSTLYSMWRAYVCREKLGETFDELISTFLFWSALRRAAIREGGYHSQISALPKCRATLYTRFLNGRLRQNPATIAKVVTLGARLVERIARRDPSEIARRQWQKELNALETRQRDRDVSREMPNLDLQVIQYGFCFLSDSLKSGRAFDRTWAERRIPELFELEMQTLPLLEGDDEGREIGGTAYPFDIWVMQRAAELIASLNSLEQARPFFESILRRGPSAMYWTQDFLQAWITHALPLSKDDSTFAAIWKAMIEYAGSLPAWKPTAPGYYCPAESLAVDLMGLRDTAVRVLGRQEYRDLVKDMAPTFRRWGDEWLKFASVAVWFAHFLSTESGRAVLSQGIQQLGTVVSSFSDRDWERDALAPTLSSALGAAWKHLSSEIETDKLLRSAFLHLLTELCSRSIPEAIHLRDRVSHIFAIG